MNEHPNNKTTPPPFDAAERDLFVRLSPPLLDWYSVHRRSLPWREKVSAYGTWVSEVMLQQTRVTAVVPYFQRFMAAFPTVQSLAEAPQARLMELWQGLGYYSRARHLQEAAKVLVHSYGGEFPRSYEELRRLPGIGDYTAGAIGSIALALRVPAVDGNVLRVASRLLNSRENILLPATCRRFRALLQETMPAENCGDFNQALMELGATVCLPHAAPLCGGCPCRHLCRACAAGTAQDLPVREKDTTRRREQMTVFCLHRDDGALAVRRRPDTGLLAGLWEFPHVAGHLTEHQAAEQLAQWGVTPHQWREKRGEKHIFTHILWEMTVYAVDIVGGGCEDWCWRTADNAGSYPMPTAFSKLERGVE